MNDTIHYGAGEQITGLNELFPRGGTFFKVPKQESLKYS